MSHGMLAVRVRVVPAIGRTSRRSVRYSVVVRALRTRAISANITAMSDDFDQRLMTGGSQVAVGMATANPLKFGEGLLTILGLETQNSATQKAVVIDFESFLGEELDTRRAESADHKRRLDNFEQRLATLSWLAEEFGTRLGERGARHSDLIALLTAGFEVWRSTADAKKRKLLGNALRNAFDPQQYEEGLTLRLLSILVELTYGEIFVLRQQKELLEKWPRVGPGVFKVSNHDLQRAHSNSSEVPLRASDLAKGSGSGRSSARRWGLHSPSTLPVRTSNAASSAHVPCRTYSNSKRPGRPGAGSLVGNRRASACIPVFSSMHTT